MGRPRHVTPLRLAGWAAVVAVIVAMVLSTRFVTPDELASMGPEEFAPEQAAEELFTEATEKLPDEATALPQALNALHQDVAGAAKDLDAAQPSETTYLFPVSGTATVVGRGPQAIEVTVAGVAPQTPVTIAIGPTVNGTILRDALGFEFGDAPNQSAYQQVGDALKARIQEQIKPASAGDVARGTKLRFVGILSVTDTGTPLSPAKPISVQPLSLEVA